MSSSSSDAWKAIELKMKKEGLDDVAIRAFKSNYEKLVAGDSGMVPEDSIEPLQKLPKYEDDVMGKASEEEKKKFLKQAAIVKLNGGLGTSMGLEKAKSLLAVKNGQTFLDIIATQVEHFREQYEGTFVKFLLMNSFSTHDDSMNSLKDGPHAKLANEEDVAFLQNKSPKIDQSTLQPVSYPENPAMEWCPPGHGDLYPALLGSGTLENLLKKGYKYMFVSNADNLGATLDLDLLSYFAKSGAPFLMEACKRSESDKKGGHLAQKKTGGLVLRESAMCPPDDMDAFQDINKHSFFNTNNLWINLDEMKKVMDANGGILPLPLIKNVKNVNPRDGSSPKVFQLETAMGAAIESFEGSTAVVVPRSRFAPVKTCDELLGLRSDAFIVSDDGRVMLHPDRNGKTPYVSLDSKHYKLVDNMETLIPKPPSLLKCESLIVKGRVKFEEGIEIVGKVTVINESDDTKTLAKGKYESQEARL